MRQTPSSETYPRVDKPRDSMPTSPRLWTQAQRTFGRDRFGFLMGRHGEGPKRTDGRMWTPGGATLPRRTGETRRGSEKAARLVGKVLLALFTRPLLLSTEVASIRVTGSLRAHLSQWIVGSTSLLYQSQALCSKSDRTALSRIGILQGQAIRREIDSGLGVRCSYGSYRIIMGT